jgi:hypothetical protein
MREFDVCILYAAIAASKRQIQKRHAKFIVARGSRDSDIWSGTWSNRSQMSESNHEGAKKGSLAVSFANMRRHSQYVHRYHVAVISAVKSLKHRD